MRRARRATRRAPKVPAYLSTWGGGPAAPAWQYPVPAGFQQPGGTPGGWAAGFASSLQGVAPLVSLIPGFGAPLAAAMQALPAVVAIGEPIVSGLGTIAAPIANAVESVGSAIADEFSGTGYTAEQIARNRALTEAHMDATSRQYVIQPSGERTTRGVLLAGDLRDDVMTGFKSCTSCARSIRRVWKRFRRR